MTEKKSNPLLTRWVYLALSGIALLFTGVIYAWSIFKVPLSTHFGWTDSQLAFTYTLTMCFFCVGGLLSGWMVKRFSLRTIFLASAVSILAGYVWTTLLPGGGIFLLYLSYSVLIGGGIGLAYNTIIATGNAWFPDKKGTSSGLMMMCFGLSTMVLGNLAASLFDMPSVGWKTTFLGLGVIIALILAVCSLVVKAPDGSVKLPAPRISPKRQEDFEQRDYSTKEMLRRSSFWICYVYGTLAAAVGSAMFNFARDVTLSFGASAALATTLVGVLSVCNGLGRILCGISFDKLGRKTTMLLANTITLLSPACMLVGLFTDSLTLAAISLCLAGLSYGTSPTISSALTSAFYGTRDFALNYSTSNTKLLFASFAATATSVLYVSTGSYVAPFALLLGLAAVAFLLNFLIRKP